MTGISIKTILAFALLVGAASQANANDWHHVDQMALSVQRQANQLISETTHYRHSRHYGELIRSTRRLSALAAHTHEIAHHGHSLIHLKSDVNEMDQMFHRVENLFDHIESDAAHGIGHVHGNTAHVKRTLKSIEGSIHHLQDDLRVLTRGTVRVQRPVYSNGGVYGGNYSRPVYGGSYGNHGHRGHGNGHGHRSHNDRGHGGVGFSIGGGSSRITFRF